jgi:hypothetical protein
VRVTARVMLALAVAATVALPWVLSRTEFVGFAVLPFLCALLAWTIGLLVARRWLPALLLLQAVAAYVAFAVVLASVLGPTAPTVLASPVDPGVLRDVTYYRACAGQARSGTSIERPDRVERDRNLAHVLTLAPAHRDGTEVAVAAPFDGVVTRTVVDEGPGDVGSKAGFRRQGNYVSEVTIVRSGIPLTGSWSATFRRVFPVVAVGDRVRAGDRIGTAPPSDWDEVEFLDGTTAGLANQPVSIDVVLRWTPPIPRPGTEPLLASFVAHLSDAVADQWRAAGFDPVRAEIPRRVRDASPCNGRFNRTPLEDHYEGDRWREQMLRALGEPPEWIPCTSESVGARKTTADGEFTCVLQTGGAATWQPTQ